METQKGIRISASTNTLIERDKRLRRYATGKARSVVIAVAQRETATVFQTI
jgi:hypothetical protein